MPRQTRSSYRGGRLTSRTVSGGSAAAGGPKLVFETKKKMTPARKEEIAREHAYSRMSGEKTGEISEANKKAKATVSSALEQASNLKKGRKKSRY